MPIPLAPIVGFALGVAFAWIARDELAKSEASAEARALRVVSAFAALVYAPIIGYFAAFHGDWAYLYFVPWRRIPSAIDLVLVVVCAASIVGGFFAAAPLARARKLGPMIALFGSPTVLFALMLLGFQRRISTSATFAQFEGNFGTEPITQAPLGRGVLCMVAIGALGVAWCVRLLRTKDV